ncbi:MAG: hypothetical protein Fur003_4360 [Candidatus Dojkabacteria bacterium]
MRKFLITLFLSLSLTVVGVTQLIKSIGSKAEATTNPLEMVLTTSDGLLLYKEGKSVIFKGSVEDTSPAMISEDATYTLSIDNGDGTKITVGDFTESKFEFTAPAHQYYVSSSSNFKATALVTKYIDGVKTGSAQKVLTLQIENATPSVSITPLNPAAVEGTNVTLTANPAGDNSPFTYNWTGACTGTAKTAVINRSAGTYTCTVTVKDFDGDTASNSAVVTFTKKAVPEVDNIDQDAPVADDEAPVVTSTDDDTDKTNDDLNTEDAANNEVNSRSKDLILLVLFFVLTLLVGAAYYIFVKQDDKTSKVKVTEAKSEAKPVAKKKKALKKN